MTAKDIIAHEEEMVRQRSPEDDIQIHRDACAEIKKMMDEIRELKSADEPDTVIINAG